MSHATTNMYRVAEMSKTGKEPKLAIGGNAIPRIYDKKDFR